MSYLLATFLLVGLLSCGEKAEEIKNAMEVMKDLPDKVEKMEKDMNAAEKKREERRSKGDTVALNYKELQNYFPKSIDGYGEPKLSGETTKMGMFSMSNAKAVYESQSEGGKKSRINIEIVDYNENYGMYAALTTFMTGYERENDQGFEKTFDPGIDNVWAMEKYKYDSKRAEVNYAVSWRFYISITGTEIDGTDKLKNISKMMDLKTLSKM